MEMEKDKLLRNVPLEIMDRLRRLSARLWAENNPVAVQLSVIVEEFDTDVANAGNAVSDYARHYEGKMAGLRQELDAHRERAAALEESLKVSTARTQGLISDLEKCETESSEKYTKEAVMMLEQQILGLKKELMDFRKLKGMDDRRIMELEEMVKTKGDEVDRRYLSKVNLLTEECEELRAANAGLEKAKVEDDASIKNLRSALEKSERESREKYTRAEVDLIEGQVADLKKELGQFRQLKEMLEHRIVELEAVAAGKGEEVERRFLAKTRQLEQERDELRAAREELLKAKEQDDASVKALRAALEKSERESREKYTRAEVDMLEKQVLDLKKEVSDARLMREAGEKVVAGLQERLKEKNDEVERKYIGRITLLEGKAAELAAAAAELEKANGEAEHRIAELKRQLAAREREISGMYAAEDMKRLEGALAAAKQELAAVKAERVEDQKRIAGLERIAGDKTDTAEKRYAGKVAALEQRVAELSGDLADSEKAAAERLEKAGELKKALISREKELMELKSRLTDAEMEYSSKLAEAKESFFQEQRRQAERIAALESDAAAKTEARRAELEAGYQQRLAQLRDRTAALEAEAEAKKREFEGRKQALEADFSASKRELIRTFDKIREEIERREAALAAREAGGK